ncbi:hypothetical protein E5F05_02175 (plasmid) [Deinococcus metallilatus]|uniref:Dehydrogenase (DH) domain-containing protein n=1 Tax=Deinococcus metallilatus TaxID=1211322 RepID=A0ABR6MV48_9DEIO|nr:hypothetical protein [Deinococcus metallilatus]MBB5295791.1 hypothetical protein [Deinococcus metallilatus]QBY06774.1 hypothetical protein E5F05_02175 [Deinococcus metallilatus]GMA14321.1 hypothetical protein GCM10025871_06520 [Deinococcus metallilatus]
MLHVPLTAPSPATSTPVDEAALLSRICVRPPYFALGDLSSSGETFSAKISAGLPQGAEVGPMQGAELSRHTAIAGLCSAALAQGDGKRRYYLAQQAWYEGFPSDAPYGAPVTLQAHLDALTKRAARATIRASVSGAPLARLEVEYTILTEAAFDRLFQSRRQPTSGAAALGALPTGRLERRGSTLIRSVERVPTEACAGHFEHYPALPVAILMGQLADLAGFELGNGQVPYRVVRASVEAQDFCWAGEAARFEVTPTESQGDLHMFACRAYANDRLTGNMQLTLAQDRHQQQG